MRRVLVTVETDGLRDFVRLPTGERKILGPVSVLKFVLGVAPKREAKRALDTFNATGSAVVTADLDAMEELLRPRVSRWAADRSPIVDSFIYGADRTPMRSEGPRIMDAKTLLERLGKIEGVVTALDKFANTNGGMIAPKLHEGLRQMVGGFHFYNPGDQSKNDAWYISSPPKVDTADAGQKLPASATHGSALGVKVETAEKVSTAPVHAPAPSTTPVYTPDPSTTPVYAPGTKTASEAAPAVSAEQPSYDTLKANTALADDILQKLEVTNTKVEALVTAGRKFNASAAKNDLYAVASRVTEIMNNVDLAQPWVRKDLTALSDRANHIHGLFANAKA